VTVNAAVGATPTDANEAGGGDTGKAGDSYLPVASVAAADARGGHQSPHGRLLVVRQPRVCGRQQRLGGEQQPADLVTFGGRRAASRRGSGVWGGRGSDHCHRRLGSPLTSPCRFGSGGVNGRGGYCRHRHCRHADGHAFGGGRQRPTGSRGKAAGLLHLPRERAAGRRGAFSEEGRPPSHHLCPADHHRRGVEVVLVRRVIVDPVPLDAVGGKGGAAPASSGFTLAAVLSVFPPTARPVKAQCTGSCGSEEQFWSPIGHPDQIV